MNARPCKELLVRASNEVGVLSDVARRLADHGIDIQAVSGWAEDGDGYIRLLTEDQSRAKDTLTSAGYDVNEREAVQVTLPHKVGMLKILTELLAREDLNLTYLVASADPETDRSLVLFCCSNNDHAVVALNKAAV